MKIALIRGKFLTKYDMEIFEALTKKHKFTVFGSKTTSEKISIPTVKLLSPMDLPNFPYKMQILNRLFVDAHYLFGLEKKLKGFDIAHTSETYFNFTKQAISAKNKGYVRKVVCTVFENIPFNNEGIRGRKKIKKNAFKHVDHFIAVTKGAKVALIEEGVSENKISVIGMGIDTIKFFPSSPKPENKNIKILFVGRIEEFKGVFDALLAFSNVYLDLNPLGYNLKLLIVGKGSKEQELDKKIKELNLLGKVKRAVLPYSSLPEVYREADILLAPSKKNKYWKEQFGMVFLEAMASGLPIISTNSGSIPEVVGSTALLSKEGDVKSLTSNLLKLITNKTLRQKLSREERSRAMNYFDLKIVSDKIDRVYKSL